MTEWHQRYRGPGVMIYWHVEKKSPCVYSQLKSCSASEVAAMVECVLRHCTLVILALSGCSPWGCTDPTAKHQPAQKQLHRPIPAPALSG